MRRRRPSPLCAAAAYAGIAATVGVATLAGTVPGAHGSDGGALDVDDRFRLALGQAVFRKHWVSAPSSTTSSDGLGPLYNARACAECHPAGGRGQPEAGGGLVLRLSVPPRTAAERAVLAEGRVRTLPEPVYGIELQPLAIQGHRSEGRIVVSYTESAVTLGDGEVVRLRRPSYRIEGLGYGPMQADVAISARVAPPLAGLGLLALVPEAQILRNARSSRDGVRGVANRVWSREQGKVVIGRFGWKAGEPSLRQQVAEAFAIDLGLSSTLVDQPAGDCTAAQSQCREAWHGRSGPSGHELADTLLDLVTYYVANVDLPSRRSAAADPASPGGALFHATGCAACHVPSLVIGPSDGTSDGPSHLRGRTIWPYSDLLLHDMGDGLADGQSEGLADGRMWRTARLWEVGRAQTPDGRNTYLHDGRARSIEEAVLWHGGEAGAAREAFARLTPSERRALVAFVKSL